MSKKRFLGAAIMVVLAMMLVLGGCSRPSATCTGCVESQGLSHMSGPLDLTDVATAAAPGLYFAGDSDTGLYSAAANQLGLATGGIVRLTLSSSGGVFGGSAFVIDVTGAISMDGDAASHFNTSVGDLTLEAETGSVIVKGDEAVVTAITLDANETVTTGLSILVGSVSGLSISGGLTDVGGGTGALANGDNDLLVAGDFEVDIDANIDGDLIVAGSGGMDISGGDITMENDETLSNDTNGIITATVDASGWFVISTGNLVVGTPATASLALNGLDAYVEGTLEADGLARLDGGVDVIGDLTISNGLFLPSFDDLTVNDGDWITPTTLTVYALDSGGAVTITLGACSNEGQFLYLIGDDANDIIINDTNVRTSDGNAVTINQWDIVAWVCQDVEWLELFTITNS